MFLFSPRFVLVLLLCLSEHPEIVAEQKGFVLREAPLIASWFDGLKPEHRELLALAQASDDQLCGSTVLFDRFLPWLLSEQETDSAMLTFASVWHRLHDLMPVSASLALLRGLSRRRDVPVVSSDLVKDPLSILSILDAVVFKFPSLLGLVLEIMSVYASASRKRILLCDEKELATRLTVVQDTVISQVLIEVLVMCGSDSQQLICAFLHQLWLENPTVLTLLHHQVCFFPPPPRFCLTCFSNTLLLLFLLLLRTCRPCTSWWICFLHCCSLIEIGRF